MQHSSLAREGARNSLRDAIADAVSDISTKARHINGPTRADKQAVLGGGSANTRLEALVSGWADQVIGKKVVVMAGAGISVAAGMPDFPNKQHGVDAKIRRDHSALRPEDIFRSEVYDRNPLPLCLWLQHFLAAREKATPTAAHLFLKLLEEKGCLLRCYTQNIDGLELAAGLPPDRLVMVHGDMSRPSCVLCGSPYPVTDFESKIRAGQVPTCQKMRCGAPVRPDMVFSSEAMRIPRCCQEDFDTCDLLLVLGTSLSVNPFGNLATRVPILCPRLLINPDQVLIKHCRHRTRQLNFDSPKAYRDVWLGGHCEESVWYLATQLGWLADLLRLERELQAVNPCGVQSVPAALHGKAASDEEPAFSPRSSVVATSDCTDVISVLSGGSDLVAEKCTACDISPCSPPYSPRMSDCTDNVSVLSGGSNLVAEKCTAYDIRPSSPRCILPLSFSGQSLASMISEISEKDFEGALNLVEYEYDTGRIISL